MSMARNLDNVPGGSPSPVITLRVDMKTKKILKTISNLGMNKSEFIRNSILEHYERTIVPILPKEKNNE